MGLAGAPRPRSVADRPRGNGLDASWRAPTAPREHCAPAAARRRTTRWIPGLVGAELLGLGIPAWLVLRPDGQTRTAVA
ncbi:sugar transferase, partial [Streptomyces sp. NPDC088270]